ncbi:MAG: hypothetical protein FJZ89_05615 [Chloroflexi bacterium]|nr:hypothetical protein [Chloroflexota bacterium]
MLDVSDPAAPVEVGAMETLGTVLDFYVAGNYAYVPHGHALQVINVSNPAAPLLVGIYYIPGYALYVKVVGAYAYVSWQVCGTIDGAYRCHGGLSVVDVSDPAAPVEVGSYEMRLDPQGFKAVGPYVYLAAGIDGLLILKYAPAVAASVPVTGSSLTSPADHTTYTFAAGTFTDTVIISHTIRSPANVPSTGNRPSIRHFFVTTAVYSGTNQLAQATQPYTITVQYTDAEQGRAAESTLGLYHWDGFQWEWVRELTSVVDTNNNTITATPRQFGMWAVLGERWQLFLLGISQNSVR